MKDIECVGERVVFKEVKRKKVKKNTTLDKALSLLGMPFNNLHKEQK